MTPTALDSVALSAAFALPEDHPSVVDEWMQDNVRHRLAATYNALSTPP